MLDGALRPPNREVLKPRVSLWADLGANVSTLSNPAQLVSPPRVTSAELAILTAAQIKSVLDALRGKPLFIIVSMALATGMRRGELLALRWKDVDLTRNDRAAASRAIVRTDEEGAPVQGAQTEIRPPFDRPAGLPGRRASCALEIAAGGAAGGRPGKGSARLVDVCYGGG